MWIRGRWRAPTPRVVVMRGGRILAHDETEAVFRAPSEPYTGPLPGGAARVAEPALVAA